MGQFLNSREPYDKYRTVILELKVDHTPEEAIAQIKEKEYALRFKGKKYCDDLQAVEKGYRVCKRRRASKNSNLYYFYLLFSPS